MKRNKQSGFTLMELMVIVGIVATAMVAMMELYVYVMIQAQVSGEKTLAVLEAQEKIEEIRRHDFDTIDTAYASGGSPGNTFSLSSMTGGGLINVEAAGDDSYTVDISVAWASGLGRTIGEDANFNGQLDSGLGEDKDGDTVLDYPIVLKTMISRR